MARRLIRAGLDIGVHDSDATVLARCREFQSLRSVDYSRQQVLFMSLPDSTAVEYHLDRHLTRLPPGSIVVDTSTTSPETARTCAATLKPLHVHFLDSPVTGEQARAEDGSLTIITSGNKEAYDLVTPLLRHMGSECVFMGEENGKAQLTKALNNALYNINVVAMAEVLTLAQESDLPLEAFAEVVRTGSGISFCFNKFSPLCLSKDEGQFDAPKHGYPMGKAIKDMHAAYCAKHDISPLLRLPLLEACSETYSRALDELHLGGQVKGAMIKVY
jgi:3-hydroxyisobutyrate dehydrogenase-like beta-hydroxyacid dehydrogenase